MKGLCGSNCDECKLNKKCKGCKETKGCPFGKKCFIYNYISMSGKERFKLFKEDLIKEINNLEIDGMPEVDDLYPLNGSYVNLEYYLPNMKKTKFLDDNEIYLGNQVECEFNDEEMKRYFGIAANMSFILICEYDEDYNNPEIIIYKCR